MSYQVIARKWRPQSFDQLVGQDHISQTLQNALRNNRLPHALLFTGPRGTGKTSSARILAKSIRCPNAVDFVPCNTCTECMDIAQSRSVDVIEIDGASNNGVDAIRELRDTVGYMPSRGKQKVYIIDEVHMLSTSAFNALLKTLEEPPPHIVFVLATTEVHKIPLTILSRCQRFDFRSISTRQITDHLRVICEKENVSAEEEALWIIARQGNGSMRDSQSLLDQVMTFANEALTTAKVVEILGLTDRSLLLETLVALLNRDANQTVTILKKIFLAGYEPTLFIQDLLENIRNLLLVKIAKEESTELLELPDSELLFLQNICVNTSEEDLHLLFDMALKGANDLPKSPEPRIVLEMVLLRMSQAPRVRDILAGNFSVGDSSQQQSATTTTTQGPPTRVQNSTAVSAPHVSAGHTAASNQPAAPVKPKVHPMSMNPRDRWLEFVQHIRSADALLAAKVENLLFIGEKDKTLDLAIPGKLGFIKDQLSDASIRVKLQSFIESYFGSGYTFQIQVAKESTTGTSAKSVAQQKEKEEKDAMAQQVAEHPMVKSATMAFKGQIKSIKGQQ